MTVQTKHRLAYKMSAQDEIPEEQEEESEETGQEKPTPPPPLPEGVIAPGGEVPIDPGKTILVVEDDLDTADSLKVKLEGEGYSVLIEYDGLLALETARKIRPALIILDVMVPGLMGYHVCRLLKFDERFRNIPIIVLTGKVDRESREIGTKAGADIYMTKPFELDDLLEEVGRLIG